MDDHDTPAVNTTHDHSHNEPGHDDHDHDTHDHDDLADADHEHDHGHTHGAAAPLDDEAHARLHAAAFSGAPGAHTDHSHANDAHAHGAQEHDHADHNHSADDDHGHDHDHAHAPGWLGVLQDAIPFLHGHSHGEVSVDAALEGSERGLWAVRISLIGLGATAIFQLIIVLSSGSVGLLADTIHNASDALTAIPLWIAFVLGRRAATRRYTYGYGRAEDVAGVIIVLMIFGSSIVAAYESVIKLAHPQPLRNVGWVALAAVVGFLGNEGVAIFRIRVGREIGSAALVADGQHARADGFTSLAVLLGVFGSALGFPLADPIVGLLITIVILFIVKDTAVTMWRRLMDAVDPELVEGLERTASEVPGVQRVEQARMRWFGHSLLAELNIVVDEDLTTRESHQIVEEVRHALFHAQPRLASITVHADPCGHSGADYHAGTAHHAAALGGRDAAGRMQRADAAVVTAR
ncbi:MAG TPA: cation diffusion facilitator family transporter [Ktedonobacterales bacterium]|nr:cation diffusion facilitator family transporter [Ktedonobacterales bacterium]